MSLLNRELVKGSLDLILLLLLEREPMYGYQMVKEVRLRSGGEFELKEGSLYPALHRLEQGGLVESYWERRPDGADRRYYRLTAEGQRATRERQEEWRRFTSVVDRIIGYA